MHIFWTKFQLVVSISSGRLHVIQTSLYMWHRSGLWKNNYRQSWQVMVVLFRLIPRIVIYRHFNWSYETDVAYNYHSSAFCTGQVELSHGQLFVWVQRVLRVNGTISYFNRSMFLITISFFSIIIVVHKYIAYRWKRSWTFSATILAMARDEVAPGEGAFLTCRTRLPMSPEPPSNTKSSTKFPSRSMAWARTPAGPLWLVEVKQNSFKSSYQYS